MLTPEQVLALTGRAFDAAVAEHVFGHTGIGYYGPPTDPAQAWAHQDSVRYDTEAEAEAAYQRYYEARYPDRPQGIAKPDEFAVCLCLCWWLQGYGTRIVPEYGTDASDDYAVLEHVREKWDGLHRRLFHTSLVALWYVRMEGPARPDLPLLYRPGDYARAALLTKFREALK